MKMGKNPLYVNDVTYFKSFVTPPGVKSITFAVVGYSSKSTSSSQQSHF